MARSTRLTERNIILQHHMKTYVREISKGCKGLAFINKEVYEFQHLIDI